MLQSDCSSQQALAGATVAGLEKVLSWDTPARDFLCLMYSLSYRTLIFTGIYALQPSTHSSGRTRDGEEGVLQRQCSGNKTLNDSLMQSNADETLSR